MFQASGWKLANQSEVVLPADASTGGQQQKVRILKRFDFSHNTMTMSAVVEHQPSGERGVYCKGSYEQVAKRCLPSSVPSEFAQVAQEHAYGGKYVLAIAGRALTGGSVDALSSREDVERDLVMLGLLLFKNPLRKDTRRTIERLREGEVRSVMITGDAAGTAICIAKEAALVAEGVPVLLGDLREGDSKGGVAWKCQDDDLTALNELLLGNDWLTWRKNYKQWRGGGTTGARGEAGRVRSGSSEEPPALERRASCPPFKGGWLSPSGPAGAAAAAGESTTAAATSAAAAEEEYTFSTEELVLSRLFEWCELAVTQRAWEWLLQTQCSPDLRKVLLGSRQATLKKGKALSSGKGDSSLAWELLTSIRIFARATPTGKISVVEGLMSQGLITSMSGDGGNDSGALRTAHVGMALSSATSATVVAPFTTNRASVAPIVDLLREGRAALATSFAGYKYCIHYGLLNSVFKFLVYWFGVGQPMTARYLQDLVGFLSFSWAISLSRPASDLVGDRPTSSLFSLVTVSSVVGMWVFNMIFMFSGIYLIMAHEDFVPFPVHLVRITQWWKLSRNWETTTIFFIYTFQQFWSAVVFSFGHLFRLSWYDNLTLLGLAASGFGFLSLLMLMEPCGLTRAFHLAYELVDHHEPWSPELSCPAMPKSLRWQLFALIATNMTVVAVWEQAIVYGAVGRYLRDRWRYLSKHVTLRL